MIRITAIAKNDIENVTALEIQAALQEAGIQVERVRVRRLSPKEHERALR